ncbi:hypothetical protein DFH09DRAFT_1148658 [Mycena vulgaris]|nr:hypothetical protein DFH09DRAFT_1148658 [Mycena vulgaris]
MSSCKRFATYSRFEGPINPFRHIALTWALICKPLFPCRGQTYNCASQNIHFPSLYCSFVDATMRSTPRPQAIALSSNKSGGRTSKDLSKLKVHQSALQVNLGSPFRILLDVDSDVETPSPLTIFFDFPKTSPLKTHATTDWADFDSDSDSDSESNASDGVQFISILSDNPFYFPPTPPTFQTTFGLPEWADSGSDFDSYPGSDDSQYISIPSGSRFHSPTTPASFQTSFDLSCASPVPSACQVLAGHEDCATCAAELFHAELQRVIPPGVKQELFLVDEECLRRMDGELFSAPMDAFMDVCLAGLRPATLSLPSIASGLRYPDGPNEQDPVDTAALCPTYYLASFLDLQQHSTAFLHPNLSVLFSKRTLRQPAA